MRKSNSKLNRPLFAFLFLAALLAHPGAHAQQLTSGADFLEIDSGARSEAMGEAFTAVADDVDALTFNPAGLALVEKPQVQYLYMLYLADVAYNFGGVALPLPDGDNTWGLGAGIVNLGTPNFDSTYGLAPAVSAADNAFLASLAYRVRDTVSFGLTGKYIMRDIAGYNANVFGGDAGVLVTPTDRLRLGLSLLNVGGQVQFISAGDPLPTTLRLGIAYKVLDAPHHSVLLSADNGWDLESQSYLGGAGAEYWFDKTLALRAGYTGDAYEQHPTAGLGLNVQDVVEFDYAYAPIATLGDTHRFSLTLRLDTEVPGLVAPTGFSARPLDRSVALTWRPAASASVVGYNVYVKKPGSDKLVLVTRHPLNDTTVKLNHLVNGENYSFALTSVSAAGRESAPVMLSAVPGAAAVGAGLLAPTGFKAALNGSGFDLTWDASASPGVAGYNLYTADDQGKPAKKLSAQPIVDTQITLKNVNPTRAYQFVLTTVNKAGVESPASAPLTVSLAGLQGAAAAQLLPPAHLALGMEDGKLRMSWDAVGGAAKYNLYVSHDGVNFNLLTPNGLSKTEVTLGGLKAGAAYTFGVSSLSANGQESAKTVQSLPAQ